MTDARWFLPLRRRPLDLDWTWQHPALPDGATACNCTVCRRDGRCVADLWA